MATSDVVYQWNKAKDGHPPEWRVTARRSVFSFKVEGPLVGILDLRALSKVRSILREDASYGAMFYDFQEPRRLHWRKAFRSL